MCHKKTIKSSLKSQIKDEKRHNFAINICSMKNRSYSFKLNINILVGEIVQCVGHFPCTLSSGFNPWAPPEVNFDCRASGKLWALPDVIPKQNKNKTKILSSQVLLKHEVKFVLLFKRIVITIEGSFFTKIIHKVDIEN